MLLKDVPPSSPPFSFKTFLPLIFFFCFIIGVTCYVGSMRKKGEMEHSAGGIPEVKLELENGNPAIFTSGTVPGNDNADLMLPVSNAEHSYLLAKRAMETGNLAAAEELLRNALLFHPKEFKLYSLLSANLFQQKKLVEAEGVLRKQLFLQPSHILSCRNLAMVLKQQKKYSEAATVLLQATRHLLPEQKHLQGELSLQLALMYAGCGQKENSFMYLRRAGELLSGRQILDAANDPLFDSLRGDPEFYRIFRDLSERRPIHE